MISPALIAVIVLALMFILASWRNINVGTLAFPAALLVGSYAGLDLKEQLAGFPVELFMIVLGITYLFSIAQSNGTVDMILNAGMRLLRGRVALLPVLLFLLAFGISSIGAVGTATLAMTLPIAMASGYRYKINVFMMAMITTCGMQAGFFSPNAIYSNTVVQILMDAGIEVSRPGLFLYHAILNLVIATAVYLCFGGLKLIRRDKAEADQAEQLIAVGAAGSSKNSSRNVNSYSSSLQGLASASSPGEQDQIPAAGDPAIELSTRATAFQWATLAGLVTLFCGVLFLRIDPGMLAISLGCLLMLVFASKDDAMFVSKVSWPTVLMLTGVITYVGVLQKVGAIAAISEALAGLGDSTTGILFISYISAIVSAFASSIGTMGTVVPLTIPLFEADPSLNVLGSTAAVTASTYLVDPSPLSILGALVLANARAEDQKTLFRKLLLWAAGMVLLAPLVTWAIMVLPA